MTNLKKFWIGLTLMVLAMLLGMAFYPGPTFMLFLGLYGYNLLLKNPGN